MTKERLQSLNVKIKGDEFDSEMNGNFLERRDLNVYT